MMITLVHYISLSAILFSLGLVGLVIQRHHLIHLLMCMELLLLAVNTQLVAMSYYLGQLSHQLMIFFILTVAAAETAVALAIVVVLFQEKGTVLSGNLNQLKG